jgi:hypothetical protein
LFLGHHTADDQNGLKQKVVSDLEGSSKDAMLIIGLKSLIEKDQADDNLQENGGRYAQDGNNDYSDRLVVEKRIKKNFECDTESDHQVKEGHIGHYFDNKKRDFVAWSEAIVDPKPSAKGQGKKKDSQN